MNYQQLKNNLDNHKARKRFGQNFLVDSNIISQIIHLIDIHVEHTCVEIGPGKGALTDYIIKKTNNLNVIELDRDLAKYLQQLFIGYDNICIFQQDALKFNFATLVNNTDKLRIIGNLPYNISTPLLFHLFEFRHIITDMHFMLQKEVVLRICAEPKQKNYGRLSVMCQYFCDTEMLLDVPSSAFNPIPKVESAIVRLKIKKTIRHTANNINLFTAVVKQAFSQRRKMIRNTLKDLLQEEDFATLNIGGNLRAEDLCVDDYVTISNYLNSKGK